MKHSTNTGEEALPTCSLRSSIRLLLPPHCGDGDAKATLKGDVPFRGTSHPLPRAGYTVAIYRRAAELPIYWDDLCGDNQVFLKQPYLQLLESQRPDHFGFVYLLFLHNSEPVGVASCQMVNFNLARNIQYLQQAGQSPSVWKRMGYWFARRINFRLLVCGSTQATGQHAYHFTGRSLSSRQQKQLLLDSLETLSQELHRQGWHPQAVLIKDFGEAEQTGAINEAGYHLFPFMPNLTLSLPAQWKQFDDYLEAMVSKYRVRARRAFKKGDALEVRAMSEADIEAAQQRMYELYCSVARSADFSLLQVPPGYFAALKHQFGDDYTVLGYYLGEELVGFCTALRNGQQLEAHFLGFDNEHNHKYQLYLNMLYDIIRLGIEKYRPETIVFSRTATEIKTSVGAEPAAMKAFMRYRGGLINWLLPFIIRQFETEEEYRQRHPFGKE